MVTVGLDPDLHIGHNAAMSRIRILPPEIANVIAAGEVVERPASVVKELVENALDAGATDIRVRLEAVGTALIEVADNGCGMTRDDAVLACQRHATSKLASVEDLQRIATLGFRGEALPSIAAAADLTIVTRVRDVDHAVRLDHCGTPRMTVCEAGAPVGTTIQVRDLFARLPARRKFLKGERTELTHIQDCLTRLALVHSAVRCVLWHGERELLAARAGGDLPGRLAELFGADVASQVVWCEEAGAVHIAGCCGLPALARAGANHSYVYVNGRPIRDRVVQHAIAEGYRTYVPRGEQPFIVLMLTLSPALVDVNVHPAKAEVRFANAGAVHGAIVHTIRKSLGSHQGLTRVALGAFPGLHAGGEGRQADAAIPDAMRPAAMWSSDRAQSVPTPHAVQEALALYRPPSGADAAEAAFRPVGQIATTYLLYEAPGGGLVIVDQHAAHERIGFEQLQAAFHAGSVPQQALLVPVIIELSGAALETLQQHEALMCRLGFVLEPFGGNSMAVKSIPALLAKTDCAALLAAMACDMEHVGAGTAVDTVVDRILMTMACHRQIRAGDRLPEPVSHKLLEELTSGDSKDRCPHGRPTWVHLSRQDIDKWFKRS